MPDLGLISLDALLSEAPTPPDWLVEPLMAAGNRVLFYGEWGAFKTWLLIDLALHLAAGTHWLGQFVVPRPRRVLYIDEEMSRAEFRRRAGRLVSGNDLAPSDQLQLLSRTGILFDAAGGARLSSDLQASAFDPEVIIVDSLRRVLAGDENRAQDVSAFWRNVEPLSRGGTTLIFSHHMKKANPDPRASSSPRDRASGSTDIMAGLDTAYAISRG